MIKNTITLAAISILLLTSMIFAGGMWYNYYEDGLNAMKRQDYAKAITLFQDAMKVKDRDMKRIKTYGMHFIEYFPHRETGICWYSLGEGQKAKNELNTSLMQESSERAIEFLTKIEGGRLPERVTPPPPINITINQPIAINQPTVQPPPVPSTDMQIIGERMGIAILPFVTRGIDLATSEIDVMDLLTTALVNQSVNGRKRFKVMERAQIEKIVKEQELGQSGLLDASTAAQIGKGIGVDAIMLGTLTRGQNTMTIDARLIDTETAEIITARDEYSNRTDIQNLKQMLNQVVNKIAYDLPLVSGLIIQSDGETLTFDIGTARGLKRGMKCVLYREGEEIRHPVSGAVLGKKTKELGIAKVVEVYDSFSTAQVLSLNNGVLQVRLKDKFITK
jgi:TolB-like protein